MTNHCVRRAVSMATHHSDDLCWTKQRQRCNVPWSPPAPAVLTFLLMLCCGFLLPSLAAAQPCYTCRTERCPRNPNLKLWCGSGADPLAAESPAAPPPAVVAKPPSSPPVVPPTPTNPVRPPPPPTPPHTPPRPVRRLPATPAVPVRPLPPPASPPTPTLTKPPAEPAQHSPETPARSGIPQVGEAHPGMPATPALGLPVPATSPVEPPRPPAPQNFAVDVISEPLDAVVRLQHESGPVLGRTPLRQVRLAKGPHTLHFSREGYESKSLDVVVRRNGELFQLRLPASAPQLATPTFPAEPTPPPEQAPTPTLVPSTPLPPPAQQDTSTTAQNRSYSPVRLAVGSVLALGGVIAVGFGIDALLANGSCAKPFPEDESLCQTVFRTGPVGAGLLAAGISTVALATVVMVIPSRRSSSSRVSTTRQALR